MRTTQVSVKEAIEILEPIPDENFLTHSYLNTDYSKCCSMGFLYREIDALDDLDDEYLASLQQTVRKYTEDINPLGYGTFTAVGIIFINDDIEQKYFEGNTLKERVLSVLKAMLSKGYEIPEIKNKENEK
jgi:hypothetical protein